jgi:hypothetical protein
MLSSHGRTSFEFKSTLINPATKRHSWLDLSESYSLQSEPSPIIITTYSPFLANALLQWVKTGTTRIAHITQNPNGERESELSSDLQAWVTMLPVPTFVGRGSGLLW